LQGFAVCLQNQLGCEAVNVPIKMIRTISQLATEENRGG